MNRKFFIVFLVVYLINYKGFAQEKITKWFPEQSIFPILEYDLLETQLYTGIFYLNAEKDEYEGAYIPVNLGIRKSFLYWEMVSMKFEFAIAAASYTQFEIIRYDKNTLQGGLLNNDFKASGLLNAEKGNHKFRFQLFHISSHLGDDYMLRNEYFELNDKTVNYEQLDFTYLYAANNIDYYIGIGEVVTPNVYRKRFVAELGLQGNYSIKTNLDFAVGTDIKFYDENDFEPDIHSCMGITFKQRDKRQLNLAIDSYYGNLPYSTLNYGKVFWIGVSSHIFI